MQYETHPTTMEININNFKHNILEIQNHVGKDIHIMPILKANAYGTFLNTRLDILNMFNIVGVANTLEGINLRKIGYKKDIFILNQPTIFEIEDIIKNDLIVGVSSNDFINALYNINQKIKIHIEIGTGMGRTGIKPSRSLEFINKIKENKNIIIDGIYTHLSSADTDYDFTKKQLDSFNNAINSIKQKVNTIRYVHSAASNGIINFPESIFNLIRPGIIIYGYPSAIDTYNKINLKPVCTLKSKITYIKEVPKNTSIGYGRNFICKNDSVIATVPIGYADGIKRCLGNHGYVIINGLLAPIVGNVCMDNIMIDVTNIKDVKLYDDVYIWDNIYITLEEIAKQCDTINYEILCTIGSRVQRIFTEK